MRRIGAGALVALAWLIPATALAHGIGGLGALPAPIEAFMAASAVVLVVGFLTLSATRPDVRPVRAPVPAAPLPRPVTAFLRLGGLAGLVLTVVAGLIGDPSPAGNPAPALALVWFWLVVPVISLLVGDVYPALDPWRWLRRAFSLDATPDTDPVVASSLVPATVVLLAFGWFLLVSPWRDPFHVAVAALAYGGYLVVMGLTGRPSADNDAFAVYNRLIGAMGRRLRSWDGSTAMVPPLRGLALFPRRRGLAGFVLAMLAVVVYDGASFTGWWTRSIELPVSRWLFDLGFGSTTSRAAAATMGLAIVYGGLFCAYLLTCSVAARVGGTAASSGTADDLAHTLVPAAFAFSLSHYFTLVGAEARRFAVTMSDPFGLGWDLFGSADERVSLAAPDPATWIWWVQAGVLVAGHVMSLVLIHDRLHERFEGVRAVHAEYVFLVLLATLSSLGLLILANG